MREQRHTRLPIVHDLSRAVDPIGNLITDRAVSLAACRVDPSTAGRLAQPVGDTEAKVTVAGGTNFEFPLVSP